jgi:hypothetical protein
VTGAGAADRVLRLAMWASLPAGLAGAVGLSAVRGGAAEALLFGALAVLAVLTLAAPAAWGWLARRAHRRGGD